MKPLVVCAIKFAAVAAVLPLTSCDRTVDPVAAPTESVVSTAHRNSALGAGDVRTVLGPRVFARTTSTPITEAATLQGYGPEATLRIANGDPNGRSRVTSGTVLVDGVEVVHPSDFGQKVASITVPITLRNTSIIGVRLAGSPGDQLTLSVDARPATTAVVSSAGGIIHLLGSQVTLEVPAGSASGSLSVTAAPAPSPGGGAIPGTVIDMGPSGSEFRLPVTLSIAFDPAAVPRQVSPGSLRMHWWNLDHWEALPGNRVDLQRGVVSAQTTHFTDFALLPDEVVFCPGEPSAASDLQTAIDDVPVDGTVLVCDGTFLVTPVVIDKPLILRSLNPAGAILGDAETGGNFQQGTPIIRIDGISAGLVRITDIGIAVTDQGIRPWGTFDKVEIDNVRFTGTVGAQDVALRIDKSTVATARVDVSNSSFSQFLIGVYSIAAVETNVRTSHFEHFGSSGVTYGVGGSGPATGVHSFGRTEGNEFTNCHSWCVVVLTVGAVTIAHNRFEALDQSSAQGAIGVMPLGSSIQNPAPALIEDNVIISQWTGLPELTPSGWAFQVGIRVSDPTATTHVVTRNTVTGTYYGISAAAALTATDNSFTGGVYAIYAIQRLTPLAVTFQRNDAVGLLGSFTLPPPGVNYQCNWWGSATGPTAPLGSLSVYTPWASEPIAGTGRDC